MIFDRKKSHFQENIPFLLDKHDLLLQNTTPNK